ncbi:hypothetical protein ACFWUP_25895 [Nocardia sp. NPDC058658]|uniref:hypothetical protein n=1 Tax=Nocardia sp. NPDC058658 TaxID=3346580 RepID=UPI0036674BA9
MITSPADQPVTDPTVIRWPEPSPLDTWWTEVMDGVPAAKYTAVVNQDNATPR